MAVTFNGTKNSLDANQLPSGYSRPVVVEISDAEYVFTKEISVLKSTVENATASTTMTNIFEDVGIGLNAVIEADITADFDATKTVTAHADLTALKTNLSSLTGSGDWLTNAVVNYLATVTIYVKVV
jgi:hypothetical protein